MHGLFVVEQTAVAVFVMLTPQIEVPRAGHRICIARRK
jgi:hypothetical protein